MEAVSLPVWARDIYLKTGCLEAGLWGGRVRAKAHCALKHKGVATFKERALSSASK